MALNNQPKGTPRYTGPNEHEIQTAYFDWVRMARLGPENDWAWLIFAIPNGAKLPYMKTESGQRISPQATKLLNEGLTPGVADVFVSVPVISKIRGHFKLVGADDLGPYYLNSGLYLEFKRPDGAHRKEQKEFQRRTEAVGYLYRIVKDSTAAIEMTINYLKGKEI